MALVDVIIPVFNTRLEYLTNAIKSLREQTLSDWNAWIIDDGSDEAYGSQLKELLLSLGDARIHHLYTEHKGATGSRNVAIASGKAPYIAFLDSDDCWMPHHLSRQVTSLNADERISLVHGYFEVMDSQGQPVHSAPPLTGLNDLNITQCFIKMLRQNFVGASTVVVRRNVIEQVGGFDATFPSLGDKDLWLRLLNVGARFHYDPEASVLYRVHPGNISHNTDLLLATRRRIIEKAEILVRGNVQFAEIDWTALKKDMTRHMYREAAEVHFSQGRYAKALKYGAPWFSGFSLRFCKILLRSCFGLLLGFFSSTIQDISSFLTVIGGDR